MGAPSYGTPERSSPQGDPWPWFVRASASFREFGARQGRYVILGTVDGLLAVLGLVVGLAATGQGPEVIIPASLAVAVALAMTNGIGSYLAESAVEFGRLARVEEAMLRRLSGSPAEAVVVRTIMKDSLTHGSFSFLGSMVPLIPFVGLTTGHPAWEALGLSIVALVWLGAFSSYVSRRSLMASVAKMVLLGLAVAGATSLLGATA